MKGFELVRGIISDALTTQLTTQGVTPVYFPIPVSDVATHVIARLKNAGYSIVKNSEVGKVEVSFSHDTLTDTQAGFDVAAREVRESNAVKAGEIFPDWPIDPSDYDDV